MLKHLPDNSIISMFEQFNDAVEFDDAVPMEVGQSLLAFEALRLNCSRKLSICFSMELVEFSISPCSPPNEQFLVFSSRLFYRFTHTISLNTFHFCDHWKINRIIITQELIFPDLIEQENCENIFSAYDFIRAHCSFSVTSELEEGMYSLTDKSTVESINYLQQRNVLFLFMVCILCCDINFPF